MRVPPSPLLRATAVLALASTMLLAAPATLALSESRRFSDFAIDNWTVAEGLPQVAVQSLAQDGDGYVWVGTQASIARFDGVHFEVFDRRNSQGLDTSMAEASYRARDGYVWFGTRGGALRVRSAEITPFTTAGTALPVQSISEWPMGRMMFGTSRGLYRLEGAQLVQDSMAGADISALLQDGATLWIGTVGRLIRREGQQTQSIPLPGGEDVRITQLLMDGGVLWMGTSRGLWRLGASGIPERHAPDPELATLPIESLCADSGGSVWISTAPNLFRRKSTGQIERMGGKEFVRNPWVNACFEDREGNLWLGSQTESLFRLWDGLVSRLTDSDGLTDPFIWALEEDGQGGALIGSNSGLMHYRNGQIETVARGHELPNAAVYELARLPNDRLWIGTRGGLRERSAGILTTPKGAERLDGLQINSIVPSGEATWVGTSGGLFRHTERDGFQPVGEGAFEGVAERVRSLLPLDDERVLVGTEDGLWLADGSGISVPDWARGLRGRMVTSLLRLPNGALLAGTLDSGLLLAAGERGLMLDERAGLPTLNVWALRLHDDWLYVSSTEGLYRLPVASLPDPTSADQVSTIPASWVISMTGRDQTGQRARCCNGGARSRALLVADELWLPSISGVLRVDLASIGSVGAEPLVHVESVTHADHRQLPAQGELRIDDALRDVRFDFTALHFRNPSALRFQYRLEGYDRDWIDAQERRSAFYTNLPPGTYRFRVRASDERGHWVQSGNAMSLQVVPRWLERRDSKIFLALAAVVLLMLTAAAALRRQRLRTQRLEQLVAERTALLQRSNERLEQANAALSVESQTDALTGLPNRRAVFQQMPGMLARHPEGVVLALVDIDHFKRVNDEYGHAAGDLVLRDFAHFLRRVTREGDMLARWGGEEFLIVFAGLPDDAVPARMTRLIDDGKSLHFDLGRERPLYLGFSIGWTRHPLGLTPQSDWAHALELADAALYQAKASGRGTWVGLAGGRDMHDTALGPHPGQRVAELVGKGCLQWHNLRGRLAPVPKESKNR